MLMDYITEIYITVLHFMTAAAKLSAVKDRHVGGTFSEQKLACGTHRGPSGQDQIFRSFFKDCVHAAMNLLMQSHLKAFHTTERGRGRRGKKNTELPQY